jgi:ubiquinone/menaquinone biosynthesis C-methylase UbiE
VLTVDFDKLGLRSGESLLDVGCGHGRHTFEALKRGASVASVDLDRSRLTEVGAMGAAMLKGREIDTSVSNLIMEADALRLPFHDETFDRVIASEVLEHISKDESAMAEIARVLRPGGTAAVTIPRRWPERVCWALSKEYVSSAGGHVRIYSVKELKDKLDAAGLRPTTSHHAHAFHSPYWWIKCLAGVDRDEVLAARLYKRFLEWQIIKKSRTLDALERTLDPLLGKSLVVYAVKPVEQTLGVRRVA